MSRGEGRIGRTASEPGERPRSRGRLRGRLSPEIQALLLCAAPGGDAELRALFGPGFDWSMLRQLALREKAIAPVWRTLQRLDASRLLPPEETEIWRRTALVYDFRQKRLESRFDDALDALAGAGIQVVVLKGAALVGTVYPSFVDRPMGDVDLLVPEDRALEARRILLGAGWTWDREELPDSRYERHYHLPPLDDAAGSGLSLELHTGLFIRGHPLRFTAERIRGRARSARFREREILIPHPLDQLLHVCLHFAWSHAMGRQTWLTFSDLNGLLAGAEPDWEEYTAQASAVGAESASYWTFRLGVELADAPVPRGPLRELRPRLPGALLGVLARHYAHHLFPSEVFCPSVAIRRVMWRLGMERGRSADGSAHPWSYEEDFALRDEALGPSVGRRIVRNLGDVRAWARYGVELLRP